VHYNASRPGCVLMRKYWVDFFAFLCVKGKANFKAYKCFRRINMILMHYYVFRKYFIIIPVTDELRIIMHIIMCITISKGPRT
jgi:hypothetical protein